jgi:HK97 family phage major capsid protein
MPPELEKLQAELEELTAKYDDLVAERDKQMAKHEEEVNELTAKVEELTGKLSEAEEEKAELITAHRKDILKMKGMEEDEVEEQAEAFGTMTNAQFNLLVAHIQTKPAQTPPPGVSGGFTPGSSSDGGDDKPVLTL